MGDVGEVYVGKLMLHATVSVIRNESSQLDVLES
jgi:hypothetical protein